MIFLCGTQNAVGKELPDGLQSLSQIHLFLHMKVVNQLVRGGKSRNSFKKVGCSFVSFLCSVKERTTSKMEHLRNRPWGCAILFPVCVFGFHQVLSACAWAAKDLAAQDHRLHKNSQFLTFGNFPPGFRKFFNCGPWFGLWPRGERYVKRTACSLWWSYFKR